MYLLSKKKWMNVCLLILFVGKWYHVAGQQTDSIVVKSENPGSAYPEFYHIASFWDKYGENYAMHLKEDQSKMTYRGFKPSILLVAAVQAQIPVYIRPNQTITIQESRNTVVVKGLPACEMEIMQKLNKNNRLVFRNSLGNEWNSVSDFEQVGTYFENRYQEQLQRLQQLSDSCEAGKDFVFCVRKQITQGYLADLFSVVTEGKIPYEKLPESYLARIKRLRSEVISMVDEYGFLHYQDQVVFNYNQFLCRESLGKKEEFKAQWDTAQKVFKGKTREFLQFRLLKTYHNQKVKNFDVYLTQFKNVAQDKDYITYLDRLFQINNYHFSPEELNTTLTDPSGKQISWKEILVKNKGKLMYTDCWASWCGPCRAEMKYYPDLTQSVIGDTESEPLTAFVFVSIDHDKAKWLAAIDKHKLTNHQHYVMSRTSALGKFFKLNTVPHYSIIDRDGKVILYDAPRPSEKKIQDLLLLLQSDLAKY
ncbi:TlpA family protein disulfide reductase [Xanthocytophaga flava]|uniref:TlpA family protein disulfide reductase n=1 Tax=Xanthocytophaga flava TaxID=3048013 RepID=UPI0028D6E6ED|nr:TlpA disulfide reductase family protein [Xanthocytophaga flavus]MDJ1466902.1 TlpA disulfide reductase family protein [Xanthocytophaga flavus]